MARSTPNATVSEHYRTFARTRARGNSPTYADWATAIAESPDVLSLIGSLPKAKQNPTLVLAAARWNGATGPGSAGLMNVLLGDWDSVEDTIRLYTASSNLPSQSGALMPGLYRIKGPLAVIDVFAGAGINLLADRFAYDYQLDRNTPLATLEPAGHEALAAEVRCTTIVNHSFTAPKSLPNIAWRTGLDPRPVDVFDKHQRRWLENLVWPEHTDQLQQLRAALRLAGDDDVTVTAGNVLEQLPKTLAKVPAYCTPVVVMSGIAEQISTQQHSDLIALIRALDARWVSFDAPSLTTTLRTNGKPSDVTPNSIIAPDGPRFDLVVDGHWIASGSEDGTRLWWRGRPTHAASADVQQTANHAQ